MASFDKFIEDLERRQLKKKQEAERLRRAQEEVSVRDRVALYMERWQNSIRYNGSSK